MRSSEWRVALLLSVAGLSACGGTRMAPVVYHHDGRLTSEEASLGQGAPPQGDSVVTPYATARVERQSLDTTATSLPPPASSPLVIAAPSLLAPEASAAAGITVKPGDTVYSLARAYGVSRSAIIAANDLVPPYALTVGSRLSLPAGGAHVSAHSGTSAQGGPLLRLGQMPPPPASAPTPVDPPADIVAATPSAKGFIWPVSGRIVSDFGLKAAGHKNDGIDIAVPEGTPVRAARAGEVIYSGNELRGYGNLVLIKHENGYVSAYAHNSRIIVKRGEYVRLGQHIADSGATGNVERPQVHFEIRKDRKPVDPQGYLPRA
jgi:LysM repeat protein